MAINTKKFNGAIAEAGKTKNQIICETHIGRSRFFKAINGTSYFTNKEIDVIAKSINVSGKDFLDIFFPELVSIGDTGRKENASSGS